MTTSKNGDVNKNSTTTTKTKTSTPTIMRLLGLQQ